MDIGRIRNNLNVNPNELFNQIQSAGKEISQKVKEQVSKEVETLKPKVQEGLETVDKFARQNPKEAMLISAAGGALLGYITGKKQDDIKETIERYQYEFNRKKAALERNIHSTLEKVKAQTPGFLTGMLVGLLLDNIKGK